MSDRQNDVLAAIDAELTKCICGEPLRPNGLSLDYCSEACQAHWLRARDDRPFQLPYDLPGRVALRRAAASVRPRPRVEFFPSPRPGEPIELAEGIDLTPYLIGMEIVATATERAAEAAAEAAIAVGDLISFTMPDGTTTRSIVTHANEDGSFDCEPAPSDARSTT